MDRASSIVLSECPKGDVHIVNKVGMIGRYGTNDPSQTQPIKQQQMTLCGLAPDRPRMIHGGKWRQVET